jgi:DNA-binding transcriptional LysR family regulator
MELRHLRYFVAVAEELHFRRAAQRLHVAQPAVSEQIRKLEAEIGVVLLLRTSRTVELTEAGAVMLEDARRVLRMADAAAQAARRARDGERARLRLGYTAQALPTVVTHTLSRLRTASRRVAIELETGDARSLLADVRADRLDAAVVCLPAPTARLRLLEIGREEAVAVVERDPRRPSGPLTLEELASERLLLLGRARDPAFFDAVVGTFSGMGLAPTLVESTAPTVEQLLLEVATGSGVALLPSSAAGRTALPGVEIRSIAEGAPAATIAIATRDEVPDATLATLLDELELAARAPRRPALALI